MKYARLLGSAAICGFLFQSHAKEPPEWEIVAPRPPAVDLESITCSSSGLFVMADAGGYVLTSPDGRTWTRYVGPEQPREIIYEEGKFVAVNGSAIVTSADGITWTTNRTPSMTSVVDITYGDGLFVAAGAMEVTNAAPQSAVFLSEDGEHWEERAVDAGVSPDPFRSSTVLDISFGGGRFVVLDIYRGDLNLWASTNGRDWINTFSTFGGFPVPVPRTLGYGNGLHVALGEDGGLLTSYAPETLWHIQDYMAETNEQIQAVAYGNGVFVAGGDANRMYWSTNGTNWSQACLYCYPAGFVNTKPIKSIAFCNGRFIAVAEGNTLYTSTNGRDWRVLRDEENLYGVIYGKGKFVAVGSNSTVWVSSDAGKTWDWAFAGVMYGVPRLYDVAYGNNTFVAVGGLGPFASSSADALNWTPWIPEHLPYNAEFRGVTFGNGLFVAVGWDLTGLGTVAPIIATSTTGTNWYYQDFVHPASGGALLAVAYGNGRYVAVGDEGLVYVSLNGTNWALTSFGTTTLRAITYYNGRFIAAGDNGTVATSTDGFVWTAAAPTSFHNRGLAAGDGVVAAGNAGTEGRLHFSPDGLSWPGDSDSFPRPLNDVAYGERTWVAVGDGGLIVRSVSPNIRLYDARYTTSGFETKIEWPIGPTYRIQATTNLVDWATVLTVTPTTSPFLFQDPTALSQPYRFYRVTSP